MKKIMKKAKSRKGFTLIEVIVVIAILAILAAIAIPSITGYIQAAEEQKYVAEARASYLQALTVDAGIDDIGSIGNVDGTYSAGTDGVLGTADDVWTADDGSTVMLFAADGPAVSMK